MSEPINKPINEPINKPINEPINKPINEPINKQINESINITLSPEELLSILSIASKLKINTRHCNISENRLESVADHSYRMTLMAMLLSHEEEFKSVDIFKVMKMCLIHDLGEAFTGDIPTFEKNKNDELTEQSIFENWINEFPESIRNEWMDLLHEMRLMQTREAKLYKAIDKLEAVISHNESDISTWLPLEYDLQYTYGKENVEFSPYLKRLKQVIDRCTTKKIEQVKEKSR